MSKEKKGVVLWLESGVGIPLHFFRTSGVKVVAEKTGGTLCLPGAEAHFGPGGQVDVKLPRKTRFVPWFDKLEVREIRDLQGNLMEQNYYFCHKCQRNSGEQVSCKDSAQRGRKDVKAKCLKCKSEWEHIGVR